MVDTVNWVELLSVSVDYNNKLKTGDHARRLKIYGDPDKLIPSVKKSLKKHGVDIKTWKFAGSKQDTNKLFMPPSCLNVYVPRDFVVPESVQQAPRKRKVLSLDPGRNYAKVLQSQKTQTQYTGKELETILHYLKWANQHTEVGKLKHLIVKTEYWIGQRKIGF